MNFDLRRLANRIVALEKKVDDLQIKGKVVLTTEEKEDLFRKFKSCVEGLQYEKIEYIDSIMSTMKKIACRFEECDNIDGYDTLKNLISAGDVVMNGIYGSWCYIVNTLKKGW